MANFRSESGQNPDNFGSLRISLKLKFDNYFTILRELLRFGALYIESNSSNHTLKSEAH